jgi:hypothetical protein
VRETQCGERPDREIALLPANNEVEIIVLTCLRTQQSVDSPAAVEPEINGRCIEPVDDLEHV